MNIIDFVKDLIDNTPCGCIEFGSILEDRSGLDSYTPQDPCCSVAFIENYSIQNGYEVKSIAGKVQRRFKSYCDYVFNILILQQSRADINFHDDIITDGRWNEYIQPKLDCFACNPIDVCLLIGAGADIVKWVVVPETAQSSKFYDGIRIEIIIRDYGS